VSRFTGWSAHPAQGPEQAGQFLAADGDFFLPPAVAFGDHVEFFVLAEEFHFHRALDLLPGQILPLGAGGFDAGPRGAHEVTHGRVAGAQFGQLLLGGDAAVHEPDAVGLAVQGFDSGEEGFQSLFVLRVTRHDFVGQGQAFGRDHQRQDDLFAIAAVVAAVAVGGFGDVLGGALEVSAREVVEEHLVFHAEEILPAGAQVLEEGVAVGQEAVEQGVELVLVAELKVGAKEIAQGGTFVPEAPATPFAAGGDQAVGHGDEQGLGPIGAFTGPA
jgi:hypothetical protein